jgi:hypothetical protein
MRSRHLHIPMMSQLPDCQPKIFSHTQAGGQSKCSSRQENKRCFPLRPLYARTIGTGNDPDSSTLRKLTDQRWTTKNKTTSNSSNLRKTSAVNKLRVIQSDNIDQRHDSNVHNADPLLYASRLSEANVKTTKTISNVCIGEQHSAVREPAQANNGGLTVVRPE